MSERHESPRQALSAALELGPYTLRELSQATSLSEKEVVDHLPHIEKSAKRNQQRFCTDPAVCHKCAFTFEARTRKKTPSRCPKCKSERIQPARFSLVAR